MSTLDELIIQLNNYKETKELSNFNLIPMFFKDHTVKIIYPNDTFTFHLKFPKKGKYIFYFDEREIVIYMNDKDINIFSPNGVVDYEIFGYLDKTIRTMVKDYVPYVTRNIKPLNINEMLSVSTCAFYCNLRVLGLNDAESLTFLRKNKKLIKKYNAYFNSYKPKIESLQDLENILGTLEPDESCGTPKQNEIQKFLTSQTNFFVSNEMLIDNNKGSDRIIQYPYFYNSTVNIVPLMILYAESKHANIIYIENNIAEKFEPQFINTDAKLDDVVLKEYFEGELGYKYKIHKDKLLPQHKYQKRKNNTIVQKKCKENEYGLCLLFCIFYVHLRYFKLNHKQAVKYLNDNPEYIRKYLTYYLNNV